MSRWAAVLFDLDGTLANTVELIVLSYRHTMALHLGEAPPDERWLSTMGTPLRSQIEDFARDGEEAERMLETYTSFQRERHDAMVRPYPGAAEVTAELASSGVRIAVVTSKLHGSAGRTLTACGLGDAFEVIVGADDVRRPKPHPEPVELALERLGVAERRGETLFVGDSPFDLRAGRDAGVRTAAATWGPFRRDVLEAETPDFWLGELRDVLSTAPPTDGG